MIQWIPLDPEIALKGKMKPDTGRFLAPSILQEFPPDFPPDFPIIQFCDWNIQQWPHHASGH